MKVFAVLLVALITSSSQAVGEEGSSAVKIDFLTLLGHKFCQGTLIDNDHVLTSAGCCLGAISAKVHLLDNVSIETQVYGSEFKSNSIYNVCLIPVDLPFLNTTFPSIYNGDFGVGREITFVSWGSDPQQSIDVRSGWTVACPPVIEYNSEPMFCTNQCVNNPGASIQGNGSIWGVNSWSYEWQGSGICAYTQISAYTNWIEVNSK